MAWVERYVRADAAGSGDGTTDTNSGANGAWTFAEAVANYVAGHRLNVRAGTYANTTTTRTLATAGTTTAPVWWRGFNNTIGDIDVDNSLAKPEITFTTGRVNVTGAHQIVSNLNFTCTGAVTNPVLAVSSGSFMADRIRVDNQHVNASSTAVSCGTVGGPIFTRCYFKATASATSVVNAAVGVEMNGCYITGGITGLNTTGGATIRDVIIDSPTTNGVSIATGNITKLSHLTVYNTTNGVGLSTLTAGHSIENCLFHTCTTAINNTTGTNTNLVKRHSNSYYNCGTTETGFGDSPAFAELTEPSDPLTNAAGGDFSLVSGALSIRSAMPTDFENLSVTSYSDRGAVNAHVGFLLVSN